MGWRHLPAMAALAAALAWIPTGPVSAQTGPQTDAKVDGQAIADTLVGNTFDGTLANGNPVRVFAGPDGSLQARFRDVLRAGEWRVVGDAFCARWGDLDPDVWGCFNVLSTGGGYAFQRRDGTIAARGGLIPGDALSAAEE